MGCETLGLNCAHLISTQRAFFLNDSIQSFCMSPTSNKFMTHDSNASLQRAVFSTGKFFLKCSDSFAPAISRESWVLLSDRLINIVLQTACA